MLKTIIIFEKHKADDETINGYLIDINEIEVCIIDDEGMEDSYPWSMIEEVRVWNV